jgi:uncharacterized protein YkwD
VNSSSARRIGTVAAAAVVVTAIATLMVSAPATASTSATDRGSSVIVNATNALRDSNGRAVLMRDGSIDSVAQKWAQKMLSSRTMTHNPKYRTQMPQSGIGTSGENVAYACGYGGAAANAETIMRAWKQSSGHRANMLKGAYTHIGIGFAYSSSSDCAYAVQDFGQYSGTFTDVPASHQFSHEIEWLVDKEITTGYADGHFKPRFSVTREAFAAFLYRFAGSPSFTPPSRSPFSDVSKGDQFYKQITWLAQQDITTGYADGTFRPVDKISREAIAAFLYRSAGSPSVTLTKSAPFKDVGRGDQFAREILWLSKSGITTGYADGTFQPYDDVSREATAAFLYRARAILDI